MLIARTGALKKWRSGVAAAELAVVAAPVLAFVIVAGTDCARLFRAFLKVADRCTHCGEDFSHPTWTTLPGAATFRTPGLASHGDAYFVIRARDTAGNEDANTHEQRGIDPCV